MSDPVTARPGICLNMIVRNKAQVVQKVLDSVAPYISSWVIVDTGSDDGTQDLIRDHMTRLGVPGELYERPWRNFGHNRTEALTLAQGHADYIWVVGADDILVGAPDFTRLSADIYSLRRKSAFGTSWRPGLFRDGLRVRYEDVVHEHPVCDDSCVEVRVEGEYHLEERHLGAYSLDPQNRLARDRDLLLAEVERNPEDANSVVYLAGTYFDLGDFVNARKWYGLRVEMGGWDKQVYYAMYQVAQSMSELGEPWPGVQDAYLRAWEFRPTHAEPLYAIAYRYRVEQRYQLGYLFAERAAGIPLPEEDITFANADIYAWGATDEQAICASWIGKHTEAFTLNRRLLARPDIPDHDRQRIAGNRDGCVPPMFYAALKYPDALVQSLQHRVAGQSDAEVVVSLVAGPDRDATEQTLNSFLHCCLDVSRVGRFLVLDAGLSARDRAMLRERYGFLEFAHCGPADGPSTQLPQIRAHIHERFWLHLGQGWQFFAPESFITRLTAVLEAEPQVFQVGINFTDAVKLTGASAAENAIRRAPDTGRYVLTDVVASGPAMFDTARLDRAGGMQGTDPFPIAELGRRAAAVGPRTASLDEVLCIAEVQSRLAAQAQARTAPTRPGRTRRSLLPSVAPMRFAVAVMSPPGSPDYVHGEIFREVAEGLHYALLALGHDSVLTNRLDLDERRTIVLQPHMLARYGVEPPKKPILYNLEPVDYHWWWRLPEHLALFGRYPVWDYSQANIERLTARRVCRPTYVPIGYVPELTRIAPAPEDIDVLFYGSFNERRRAVLQDLRARGFRVEQLFGLYGADRDVWIGRSKIVINIHQYEAQAFEIARVSYLLANRRAVVSERGAHPADERDLESGIAFAKYDELADRCVELLSDECARRELAERGYQAFSARNQATILRRALSSVLD